MRKCAKPFDNQRGISLVFIAFCLFTLLVIVALAVDIGHLAVVRNELQNAADAGALAAARQLYNDEGTSVNPDANQVGKDAAAANFSDLEAVEVLWTGGNTGDVQRGHWSFGLGSLERGFYANDSTATVNLWNVNTVQLDENVNFINAVKVTARRENVEAQSYFARIMGHLGFKAQASAVAYIGFAGDVGPGVFDIPIAICKQSIVINGDDNDPTNDMYACNIGRMLNSGSNNETHNTAGWTNFTQPCDTADANEMRALICGSGNPYVVQFGEGIGAGPGVQQSTLTDLIACWKNARYDSNNDDVIDSTDAKIDTDNDGWPDRPWNVTLPVIDCQGNNVSNCSTVKGAVNLNVVWITDQGNINDSDAPRKMLHPTKGLWTSNNPDYSARWNDFRAFFDLKNVDNIDAEMAQKSIYFLPDCTEHEPEGTSKGENFGILAKIPVLVK
jgi:Flp pilus assembly protein TadG